MPSYHAVYRTPGKIPVPKPDACCFSIPRPVPAAFFEEQLARPAGSANGPEANEMRRRHGCEIVGPAPF